MSLLGQANPYPVVTVPLVAQQTGDNIVTGVAGKRIKVVAFILADTTLSSTVQFEDGATNYTGDMEMDTGPIIAPYNEAGWFTVTAGLGLDITVGGLGQASGTITYVLVD